VGDLVEVGGHELVGYIDHDPDRLGTVVEPLAARVSHLEEELLFQLRRQECYPEGVDAIALGIGDNRTRLQWMEILGGLESPPLVHPSAAVSQTAQLGRGSVVFPQVVINAGATIGAAVIVNSGVVIEHDCVLGAGVHISPDATACGGVRIGDLTWVGAGATVIHGLTLGAGVIVGAGSTVLQDVDDGCTVGSLARPVTHATLDHRGDEDWYHVTLSMAGISVTASRSRGLGKRVLLRSDQSTYI
jgi:sugar O-acyltransferase (sialic acid O-acetyltransferase NeuD family)